MIFLITDNGGLGLAVRSEAPQGRMTGFRKPGYPAEGEVRHARLRVVREGRANL